MPDSMSESERRSDGVVVFSQGTFDPPHSRARQEFAGIG